MCLSFLKTTASRRFSHSKSKRSDKKSMKDKATQLSFQISKQRVQKMIQVKVEPFNFLYQEVAADGQGFNQVFELVICNLENLQRNCSGYGSYIISVGCNEIPPRSRNLQTTRFFFIRTSNFRLRLGCS